MRARNPFCVGLLVALLAGCAVRGMHADAYDDMRAAWFSHLTGGTGYDPADPLIKSSVATVSASATTYWGQLKAAQPFTTTCFSDLAFGSASANITTAFSRLQTMAQAYWSRGGSLYRDASMRADLIAACDWLYANAYNESKSEYGNWWDWEIGVPLNLNPTVTLMYDFLTPAQLTNYMNAVNRFTPNPDTTGGGAGANGAWGAIIVGVRAVLVKDDAKLKVASDRFSLLTANVTGGDGYFDDGSYIGHTYYSYTGGYGFYFLQSLADGYCLMTPGTPYPLPDARRAAAYAWVKKSYWPLLYRGQTPYFAIGREIGRGPSSNRSGAMGYSMLELTGTDTSADAATVRQMAKSVFLDGGSQYPGNVAQIVQLQALAGDNAIPAMPDANMTTIFPVMQKAVALRNGWGVGLSMYSTKIYDYEDAGENKRGWHQADGMLYLNNADTEQFNGDFWPTVNSYRLPGTTVTQNTATAGGRANGSNFAGGADVGGLHGAAGFVLQPGNGQTLTANKSWFFFDDEVVCLGTGIASTDGKTIETVIENRQLNSAGSNALTVNGAAQSAALGNTTTLSGVNWMHLAGSVAGADIGYVFPTPTSLSLVREARMDAWSSIRTGSSTASVTGDFFTATASHGSNPANGSYAYILLPSYTPAQVAAYAAAPVAAVLQNDANVSAVRDTKLGVSGAVFWQDQPYKVLIDSTPTYISSDRKAVVMVQDAGDGKITVAVSDPTQGNTAGINVELTRAVAALASVDAGVSVTQLSPTLKFSVATGGARGKTFHATFAATVPVVSSLVPVSAVSASANDGNVPSNTLDNNFNTRWSAQGDGQWIQYDFPGAYQVTATSVAFYGGSARTMPFDVRTSIDGANWATVASFVSSGKSNALQSFVLSAAAWARHVRIVGHGNSQGTGWNSLTEVQFFGSPAVVSFADYQGANFTPAQLSAATVSGAGACPSGDGMSNLMKYSQGLSPGANVSVNGGGPTNQLTGGYLTLTFVRMKNATDLVYTPQVSDDLSAWQSGPAYVTQVSATDLDGARQQVVVRNNTPISAGGTCCLRLAVSRL